MEAVDDISLRRPTDRIGCPPLLLQLHVCAYCMHKRRGTRSQSWLVGLTSNQSVHDRTMAQLPGCVSSPPDQSS